MTVGLALGILVGGAAIGAVLLWLVGPVLTVLLAVVAAMLWVVIRSAVRSVRRY